MHTPAALVATAVLTALAVFQLGLTLGAPWGRLAWGGQHAGRLPGRLRVGSAVSILLYAAFAAVLLDRAAVVDVLPDAVSRVGAWVLIGYFTLGILLNGISRSPAERAVMTPTTLVLAVCSLLVALAPQR